MKKAHYLYMGYHMNLQMFYCTENEKIYAYLYDEKNKHRNILPGLFSLISVLFYLIMRKIYIEVSSLMYLFVVIAVVLGIIFGILCSVNKDKHNHQYFSGKNEFKLKREELKKLRKEAAKVTWFYLGILSFFTMFVFCFFVMIYAKKDLILIIVYAVIWLAYTFCILQFCILKRIRMIHKLSKQ